MNNIWTRKKLTQMLYHNFIGTLADNAIEIGWVLCFSLLADKFIVERITTMFGLNDGFWVILSSTYYTTRTALTTRLPQAIEEKGPSEISKQFKNNVYLFYLMLLPVALSSLMFMPKLLVILGVDSVDLPFYLPYFRLSVISILIAAPWTVMVPSLLRTFGESKIATYLDHLVAWSMLIGIFITTHIFKQGVLWALVVNIVSNALPLFWFLKNNPIENFWEKGFEFSRGELKKSWEIVKWELVRRLSPRVSTLIGFSLMLTVNPIFLAVKYWVANLAMFVEGWIDAMAGLLNSHVSKNTGVKNTKDPNLIPYQDNEFLFRKSVFGIFISILAIYLIAVFFLGFLPESIHTYLIKPYIYILLFIESFARLRYYMWLSISRSYRKDLNGTAQLFYAIPTAIGTPLLTWIFLFGIKIELFGIFLTSAIVGLSQWTLTEIYFRKNLKD